METKTASADLSALRIGRERKDQGSRRRSIKWKIIIPAAALAAAAAAYLPLRGSFGGMYDVEVASASLTSPSQANAVLNASGYVVAQQKAAVASKGTGRLVFLGVEEGDRVKRGQTIARLEDQDVMADLAKARADLELARADLDDALLSLERQQKLYESGLTSKAELDAAEARSRRVQAAIRSAEANVTGAEVAVENTRIRAPFDGTVLTKNADVGEVVAPFGAASNSRGAVVTIADMSSLEVEADVSESNITRVRIAQPTEIVLDAYPDVRYRGYVAKIVPTADRAKATVLTKVRFTERDERVLPEMSAKVTFLSKEADKAPASSAALLTVPSSCVVVRDDEQVVFRLREEVVDQVPVSTGRQIGMRIEIRQGLREGDRVVVSPPPGLSRGTKVKVKA